ncbi:MAG TPA: hypothetical protein VLQ65_15490, partial [Saliniramus sp.]|nr:hypothetical protein [Saliniramus sp.]
PRLSRIWRATISIMAVIVEGSNSYGKRLLARVLCHGAADARFQTDNFAGVSRSHTAGECAELPLCRN